MVVAGSSDLAESPLDMAAPAVDFVGADMRARYFQTWQSSWKPSGVWPLGRD